MIASDKPVKGKVDASTLTEEQIDTLERDITNRPMKEELKRQGILKDGGRHAGQQMALKRQLAKDSISRQILARPSYETLVESNIVPSNELAPGLQAAAKKLEKQMKSDQLNKHLYSRAEPDEIASLFPADDVAPRLRSARIALEQAFTRDHLNNLLSSRPTSDELLQRNILKSSVAPSLQAAQVELQKQLTADHLNSHLDSRTAPLQLARDNIIGDASVSAAIQPAQRNLKLNLAKSNLYHALQTRPTRQEVERMGIIEHDDDVSSHQNENVRMTDNHSQTSMSYAQQSNIDGQTSNSFQRRSRKFILTRLLLKFVANLSETGEISIMQKGQLKNLIVDQNPAILAAAEIFELDGKIDEFKDSLMRFARRQSVQ